jgi:predicted RNase H-like HicB family nuclease
MKYNVHVASVPHKGAIVCSLLYEASISMRFTIEVEQEEDGRWLAEIPELPGVLVYGQTRTEAIARVQALALRVLADRLEHGETVPALGEVFAVVA